MSIKDYNKIYFFLLNKFCHILIRKTVLNQLIRALAYIPKHLINKVFSQNGPHTCIVDPELLIQLGITIVTI